MIHHISIAAKEPLVTAKTLAKFWDSEALPFPMYENSYVVFLGEKTSACIEVYPAGVLHMDTSISLPVLNKDHLVIGGAFHAAISTPLTRKQVIAVCELAGWCCREEARGEFFSVIEVWVENHTLFELLTPDMSQQYNDFANAESWRSIFGKCS